MSLLYPPLEFAEKFSTSRQMRVHDSDLQKAKVPSIFVNDTAVIY